MTPGEDHIKVNHQGVDVVIAQRSDLERHLRPHCRSERLVASCKGTPITATASCCSAGLQRKRSGSGCEAVQLACTMLAVIQPVAAASRQHAL